MQRLMAVATLVTLLIGFVPTPAHAGAAVNAALALGAFAVLSPLLIVGALAQPFVYAPPPPVYATPPAYATPAYTAAPAYPVAAARQPAVKREVVYAHGRYVLLGDGAATPYQWVWVPNPPAGAPPAPPR